MKKNTMALVQIVEPNTPVDKSQPRLAVGIDLGTTNSLVASVRNGVPVPLADTQGRFALASAVRYLKDNTVSVGRDANSLCSGKNIMSVMMLAANQGTQLLINAEGEQAAEALAALQELVELRFHEES